jgi:uncharacterized protein YcbK (DUF882 family)
VTLADLALRREASVFSVLTGALGVPSFFARPSPVAAPVASVPPRSRIEVTPLPKPSVTVKLRMANGPDINSFTLFTDGTVDLATEPALKHAMHCRRTGRELALTPGVLAMLASVAEQWPGRVIDIVSAFRAPPFGVPHSKHFIGHAIDLRVEGVKTTKLRDFIWRSRHEIGVGYYLNEDFVHMDWRPGEPDMAWSAGHEGDQADYNPRWAWTARHPAGLHACERGCS